MIEGWYLDAAFTQRLGSPGEVLTAPNLTTELFGNVDIYAKWTQKVIYVSFDTNGTSPNFTILQCRYDGNYGDWSRLPSASRDGYLFDGWYLGDQRITDDTKVAVLDDHTLVAHWVKRTDSITYQMEYQYIKGIPDNPASYRHMVTPDGGSAYDEFTISLDLDYLEGRHYYLTTCMVTIETDSVEDTYADGEVWLCDSNKNRIAKLSITAGNICYDARKLAFMIDRDVLGENNTFYLEYCCAENNTNAVDGSFMVGKVTVTIYTEFHM